MLFRSVKAAAVTLARADKLDEAVAEVRAFHRRLCELRVLDPACGSGNFLYVTLEHLKRLEGEVIAALDDFGDKQGFFEIEEFTVDPHQLLGIEINPRAAAIADLVLWIGYLQWHFRTRGEALPREPVLKKFRNIECRDAVLAYDAKEIVKDKNGQPVTRWDGRTYKKHAVTGEDVPDESARVPLFAYTNARPAEWPAADYIIGNPPYLGARKIKLALGIEYVEALRSAYRDIPEHADFVMYWWDKAAKNLVNESLLKFGFITTNSIVQPFSRKIIDEHLSASPSISITFAIPDHPWVDSTDGASVRVAMTAAEKGEKEGLLQTVLVEEEPDTEDAKKVLLENKWGKIFSDLTIGANVVGAIELEANSKLSCVGYQLTGTGFILTFEEAKHLGFGITQNLEKIIYPLRNGSDLTKTLRRVLVIDLFGYSIADVQSKYPEIYQWILDRVKPERDQNNRPSVRERWWIFGEARSTFRPAITKLNRYILTCLTAKHRTFVFVPSEVMGDSTTVMIATEDSLHLGILSSRIHVVWSLSAGGRLGVGNDPRYNLVKTFQPYPFPDCNDSQKEKIRALGEQLDAHRKRQQALHPTLTITDMYNVLEKLRAAAPLSDKEKIIHEHGLVSVLKQLHDELDAAVADAYGWPANLSDEEILARLVALNAERAEEEKRGVIRWLRPEYQNPNGTAQSGFDLGVIPKKVAKTKREKQPWPKSLAEQARAVQSALATAGDILTAAELAQIFKAARVERVQELLQTLVSLGQARDVGAGKYSI